MTPAEPYKRGGINGHEYEGQIHVTPAEPYKRGGINGHDEYEGQIHVTPAEPCKRGGISGHACINMKGTCIVYISKNLYNVYKMYMS